MNPDSRASAIDEPFSLYALYMLNQFSPAVMRLWTLGFSRKNDNLTTNQTHWHGEKWRKPYMSVYSLRDDFSGFNGQVRQCDPLLPLPFCLHPSASALLPPPFVQPPSTLLLPPPFCLHRSASTRVPPPFQVYLCAIGLLGAYPVPASIVSTYKRVIGVSPTWCSKENYVNPKGEALVLSNVIMGMSGQQLNQITGCFKYTYLNRVFK